MANETLLDLIDRNALLESNMYGNTAPITHRTYAENLIQKAPSVDAEPVVHGYWVKHKFLGHGKWVCSECQMLGSPQWKRCPVCEAKMDKNENP